MRSQTQAAPKARLAASDRRQQLVGIAVGQIATKGFEGLRFQEVAKQAGINNATLYYHFPTKEALIQGVVSYLTEEFKKTRRQPKEVWANARQELHIEFRDLRELLHAQPRLFIVFVEMSLRRLRDPAINKVEKSRDDLWQDHLTGMIRRGIEQGVFRRGIHAETAATALMAQFKGIGCHATLSERSRREVDRMITEIERQVDHWLTTGNKEGKRK